MNALAKHLLTELKDRSLGFLDDSFLVKKTFVVAPCAVSATTIKTAFHHFNHFDISDAAIIAGQSLLSFHTRSEYKKPRLNRGLGLKEKHGKR